MLTRIRHRCHRKEGAVALTEQDRIAHKMVAMNIILRYRRAILLVLMAGLSVYLLLPLVASSVLSNMLRDQGYKRVIIQLGYPRWSGMRIPVVSFQQDVGHETLLVSLTNAELQYRPLQLWQGHVDRVSLPDVAVQILHTMPGGERGTERAGEEEAGSPWALLTAGDLLRRLPSLPFDELRLERLTVFREQATGPLRKVTISGVLVQQDGELGGHLSFQGQDTAPYGLTVAGHSASTWSATLASQRPPAAPIVSWQSSAHRSGEQIRVDGRLEVNVREFAPFIALLVPIGPELGRVTGQVAMSWSGTAAADVALLSIWEDERTQVNGHVRGTMTLPALQGVAKDIAVAWEGPFTGTASRLQWTLNPGVLMTATVNVQPRVIPEAIRMILPKGDQPVRIDQREPVQGQLFWGDAPFRITTEGPLAVRYGRTPGPLIVEFQTGRMEGMGTELIAVEGGFRVEGELSKTVTDQLFAKEAAGGFHGTLSLAGNNLKVTVLPSSFVTLKSVEQGTLAIARGTLQLTEALPVHCDVAGPRCAAGPAVMAVRIPVVHLAGREIRVPRGQVTVHLAEVIGTAWNMQATVDASEVTADVGAGRLTETNWTVKVAATQAGVKADVHAGAPAHGDVLTATVEQPFGSESGVLHGRIGPLTFNGGGGRLSRLLQGLAIPIEVTDGRVIVALDASWSGTRRGPEAKRTSATITVDNLSGRYQDYIVSGVNGTIALRGDGTASVEMVQPALVTAASLRTGIDFNNVAFSLWAGWKAPNRFPVLEIKDLQCDVFGGAATSPGARVDWAKLPATMTVSLRKLDLAKVLSLEQQKGLQGTGVLNGTVPLAVTAAGITVDDGRLEAEAPGGVVRYPSTPESPKVITEADSHLHLVTQALNNFHYTVLRVGLDYADTGWMDLKIRLEGQNPDLKKSPPIHFNLAVQEHVPTLLKSLRLVRDLEESLQKKYKGSEGVGRGT
jgi:hypothetical protein